MDTSALHTVTETFASYLSEVTAGDLAFPTPCAGWNVNGLYHHMLEENVHFGLAITGDHDAPADPVNVVNASYSGNATRREHTLDASYRRTATYMERAFASTTDESQIRQVPGVPGSRSIHDLYEMQLCDTVIHTWDLTRSIGFEYDVEPEIAATVLRRLELLPDSARGDDKAFGHIHSSADQGHSALERIVLLSGRIP